jgi:CDGSH-type Zn-finger protein
MKLVVLCTLIAPATAFVARSAAPIECELYFALDEYYIRQCHCSQHIFPFLTSILSPSTYFWCILARVLRYITVEQYIYSSSSSSSFIYTLTTTTTCTTARLFDGSTVGVINASIDKDSPKVATMDKLVAGDKKVYCRCWQSGTFPLCDASHMAHNKATGDNVGPLIVSVDKAE